MEEKPKRARVGGSKTKTAWHEPFLERLRETGVVTHAMKGLPATRALAYMHREKYPKFAEAWDQAVQESVERLEAECVMRAKDYSDLLLIFLLKANKPEKYRETRRYEVSGPNGAPVEIATPKERAERLAALLEKVSSGNGGDDSVD